MPYIYTPRSDGASRIASARVNRGGGGGASPVRPPMIGNQSVHRQFNLPTNQDVSRARGAPERIEADVMGAVQTAAMAPGHALERPVAFANTALRALTGTPQEEKGPLDGLLEGIGSIGLGEANIGNALGAVGRGIIAVGDAPIAAINAVEAGNILKYATASDSDLTNRSVGGFLGIGSRRMTVGEYKQHLADRGFFDQVDPETGQAIRLSWEDLVAKARDDSFGFGDRMIDESGIVDIAGRIALDPFNLLLGAGVIGKAGKVARWAFQVPGARQAGRVVSGFGNGYMADMVRTGVRAANLPGERIAARAITAGRMEAATLRGLGRVLATPRALLLPGEGSVARRYARGALRLEVGTLGAEVVSGAVDAGATGLLGEDNIISGFMEPIHDASQALLADKPMSQDITFMMVSAFAMPAIPLLREDAASLSARARESFGDQDLFLWSQRFGADESGLSTLRDPMGRRRGKAKESSFLDRIGGKAGFARLIDHIDMRIAFERLSRYDPIMRHFESFDEAMARSKAVGHVVAQEARRLRDSNQIRARDRIDEFERWGKAHNRTIIDRNGNLLRNMPERVDFELSNDELIDQWVRYREVHEQLEARFTPVGEAILGRANRLTKEDLSWVGAAIQNATKDGRVNASFVRDLLSQTPAMFEDAMLTPAQREFWNRLMNLGVGATSDSLFSGGRIRTPRGHEGTLDAAQLHEQIAQLVDHAPSARELYHEAARAEAKVGTRSARTGGPVSGGRLRKIYSIKRLRDMRVETNGEVRKLTKEIDADRVRVESKWTKKGNLRVRRPIRVTPQDEIAQVAAQKASDAAGALDLTPDQQIIAQSLLEARAIAWASQDPSRRAVDYLRRLTFEKGGESSLEALFQGHIRARTALTAFPTQRAPREGSTLARRLARAATRAQKKADGILPDPDTTAGRQRARELLPDTEEIRWLKEVARGEILSPDGPGPYAAELAEIQDVFYRAVVREQRRQLSGQGFLGDDVRFQELGPEPANARDLFTRDGEGPIPEALTTDEMVDRMYEADGNTETGWTPDTVYHLAPKGALQKIAREGVRPQRRGNNIDGTPWAAEFAGDQAVTWWHTDPRELRIYSGDVLLRTKTDGGPQPRYDDLGEYITEPGQGVPASRLEYLGADNKWHPVKAMRPDVLHQGAPPTIEAPALNRMFDSVQEDWGGATYDPRTGSFLEPEPGRATGPYASAVPGAETVSLTFEQAADPAVFRQAIADFVESNADALADPANHLGIFRDADKGTVDIDVSKIDQTIEDARATQRALGPEARGAYDFATQNGVFANELDDVVPVPQTGDGGSTPIDASLAGGRVRGTLEPLLDQPAPQELIDAGMGDAAPLEWIKDSNGGDVAIPGGFDGEFSLWDAWRLKAQQIDPNLIPEQQRIALYAKLFRSQRRALTNPVDVWNRLSFAHISPQLDLLSNEAGLAAMRSTSIDDIARIAEMPHEELVQLLRDAGSAPYPAQLKSLQTNARRFVENPDWFALRDGEDLSRYSERIMSVLDGAGMKIGNFSAMLGDPMVFNRGTMDSHMVDILIREGLLPEDVAARLTGKDGGSIAPAAQKVSVLVRGKPNPNVPEHLRDLPWTRSDGKVMVFGSDYRILSDAFDKHLHNLYPDLPFHSGGGQWFMWDMERRIVEPHTAIWPGSDTLPRMAPDRILAGKMTAKDAGYFRRKGAREPFDPAQGIFWQDAPKGAKGSTEFVDDVNVVIRGLESPDVSTFVHELGHVFRRDLDAEDLAVAEGHYKVVDGQWTREAEEAFARDFEKWTRTAKDAPAGLERVFEQLKTWMIEVYRAVLKRGVNPKIADVFKNLFEVNPDSALARKVDRLATARQSKGAPGEVRVLGEPSTGVTVVKYGDDGDLVAYLDIDFDRATGKAAPNGLAAFTVESQRGKGHMSELYDFAERQGWEVEQASARSGDTLTAAGRAFQKSRWNRQRGLEQTQLQLKNELLRERRREARDINARAEELRTVRVDPSFLDENGNPTVDAETLDAIREQTAFVQDNFPRSYGIEKAPKVSYARYQPEDSHLAALLTERSNLAQVLFDYGPLGKLTQFVDWLTRPVKASKMAHDGRQQVYNLLLPLGAKTDEVTAFLNALRDEQTKGYTVGKMHQPFFRGVTAILPNRISTIAREAFAGNEAFIKAFDKKYGGAGVRNPLASSGGSPADQLARMHVLLDEAHNSLVRKVDLQVMRGQKVGRFERIFRSGYWAWQHLPVLRGVSDITRMASKVYYPLFRFQMDLRWQALNVIEADTIAFFRDGIDGTRFSSRRDRMVRRGGQDVNVSEAAIDFHGEFSGMPMPGKAKTEAAFEDTGIFLTNQNLQPVLRRSFDIQRIESIDTVLNEMADSDPVIQLLRRKYGDEKGTWAQQIDEMLYAYDRKGVKQTIDEAVRRVGKDEGWGQADYDQMVPLIQKLVERNQRTFDDLVQIHIGNIDRSRLERTLNSYWLYWPISYQIKATKWMAGVLTQRAFGSNTNLGGAWSLNRMADRVRELVESNPEFAEEMEGNEDWWFVASMLLPIAPWDWGVSLNRHVRYVGGNELGLWPEYASVDEPGDYLKKALEMGPVYTVDLIGRLLPQAFGAGEEDTNKP